MRSLKLRKALARVVGITLRVYAHVLPHMQQSAMTAMAGLIGESPPLVRDPYTSEE